MDLFEYERLCYLCYVSVGIVEVLNTRSIAIAVREVLGLDIKAIDELAMAKYKKCDQNTA